MADEPVGAGGAKLAVVVNRMLVLEGASCPDR